MIVHSPRLALLLAATVGSTAFACHDEPAQQGGGTTPAARRGLAGRALEGGCPDEDPVQTLDLNRDGNIDFAVIPEDDGTCRQADLNFDGQFDLYRHRDAAGNLVREEADGDWDSRLDSAALYQGGADPYREEFDTNWDGRIDLWVDLRRDCPFARGGSNSCTTECAVTWCQPRSQAAEEGGGSSAEPEAPPAVAVLYRDSNGDGIWEAAEVLLGEHPLCVAFNTNAPGDTAESVHPEVIEVYKPNSARLGRPDIDYLRRDYLDLEGNPIIRCEDSDGAIVPCPSSCGR
jgi:hypothetical protein